MLDLRDTTQAKYRSIVDGHLRPRFNARRLGGISADDLAQLVRDLRGAGRSEATIAVAVAVIGRIYMFAKRRLGWNGTIPTTLMLSSERPKVSLAKRRPIFVGEQLEQTIAAAHEPFRTLFAVAALTGARISELCGLTWADVRFDDLDEAEIEFSVGRSTVMETVGLRRPTAPHGRYRFRASSLSCSAGIGSQRITAGRPTSCSRLDWQTGAAAQRRASSPGRAGARYRRSRTVDLPGPS